MEIKSYQDLKVWQAGMTLGEMAYRVTESFPRDEMFGMTSQIRRAASSVPANIAEGWGRATTAEFQQFLRIAHGSLRELETHLLLSTRIGLTSAEKARPLLECCSTLGRQIVILQRKLSDRRRN